RHGANLRSVTPTRASSADGCLTVETHLVGQTRLGTTFRSSHDVIQPLELLRLDDSRVLAVGQDTSRRLLKAERESVGLSVVPAADAPGSEKIPITGLHLLVPTSGQHPCQDRTCAALFGASFVTRESRVTAPCEDDQEARKSGGQKDSLG